MKINGKKEKGRSARDASRVSNSLESSNGLSRLPGVVPIKYNRPLPITSVNTELNRGINAADLPSLSNIQSTKVPLPTSFPDLPELPSDSVDSASTQGPPFPTASEMRRRLEFENAELVSPLGIGLVAASMLIGGYFIYRLSKWCRKTRREPEPLSEIVTE